MWTHAYLHTPTDTTHWFQLQDKRVVYYRLSSQSWAEKPEHYRHKVAAAVTTSYSPCWSLLRLCNKCGGCNLHITVTYNKVFMDYVNMAETFIKHRVSLWVYCAPHGNELQEPSYWHCCKKESLLKGSRLYPYWEVIQMLYISFCTHSNQSTNNNKRCILYSWLFLRATN